MTETTTISYHKPKIRKNNFRRDSERINVTEAETEISVSRKALNSKDNVAVTECNVPTESIFNCSANTLRSLGLTGKYDGFMYMCRAIEEILKSIEPPHFQSIYYDIGKEFEVNRCSVERSIRYSISFIKRAGNRNNLSVIFGEAMDDEKNFSNSKFLTILAADVYEKLTVIEGER